MAARLQQNEELRRNFLADVTHELRTPLTVIQGSLEGMLDGIYPRDDSHVRQVLEQTRMLARLVEDLRTSAHAESGTLPLQKEPTDLAVLIAEVAGGIQAGAGEDCTPPECPSRKAIWGCWSIFTPSAI